jgi:hypothetical protein
MVSGSGSGRAVRFGEELTGAIIGDSCRGVLDSYGVNNVGGVFGEASSGRGDPEKMSDTEAVSFGRMTAVDSIIRTSLVMIILRVPGIKSRHPFAWLSWLNRTPS